MGMAPKRTFIGGDVREDKKSPIVMMGLFAYAFQRALKRIISSLFSQL